MEPSPIIKKYNNLKKGITLMEITVAAVITTVLLLAITQVDLTRTILANWARSASKIEAPLALAHIMRRIQNADRIVIVSPSHIQFRYWRCPTDPADATCFDNAANARWGEYKRVVVGGSQDLRSYDNTTSSCSSLPSINFPFRFRFYNISAFSVSFQDATPNAPPPGGEPASQDNNMLLISITSFDPNDTSKTYTYTGQVAIRAGVYSDINSTASDSGSGLALPGISNPPAGCCGPGAC